MLSEWILIAYGFVGGFAAIIFPKICLCCCGFTCCGVRKYSVASRLQSNIGDVEAGSYFSRSQSSGSAGFPWYINLMLFLFGFTTTVIILLVESMGGFDPYPGNVTRVGNLTEMTESMHFLNVTTVLPMLE